MQLITKELPDSHNLFLFGDEHRGSALFTKTGWNQLIHMMLHKYDGCKNNYGIDGGDAIEAICADDKRFSPEKLSEPLPLEQVKQAEADRQLIKHLLLYMLMGNHERSLWRFGDLTEELCKRLCVDYGTYTAKLTVVDKKGNQMYKLFDTHGRKNITSTADDPKRRYTNLQLTLKRHLKFKAGDCAVMIKHHTHKLLVCKPESELYLTDNGKQIQQAYTGYEQNGEYIHPDARWYGNAGSFLRLYGDGISGYAEIGEYDPVELGFLVLKVRDKRIIGLESVRLNI